MAHPAACAEACGVIAYAMLRCEELHQQQCWYRSRLTSLQCLLPVKYPSQDFKFWVKYGSWSRCAHCGSMHFNDEYFAQSVYEARASSTSADLVSSLREKIPADPCEHADGTVSISSRWWYLPGMFKPVFRCGTCTPTQREGMPSGDQGAAFSDRLRRIKEKHDAAWGDRLIRSSLPLGRALPSSKYRPGQERGERGGMRVLASV